MPLNVPPVSRPIVKLLSIKPAKDGIHKYVATFQEENRTRQVKFGRQGYSDYTMHKDAERKERYLDRHKANENWNKPDTAGALSRWILWNKPSLRESIEDYKQRFFTS
jgi:hypothetical protein